MPIPDLHGSGGKSKFLLKPRRADAGREFGPAGQPAARRAARSGRGAAAGLSAGWPVARVDLVGGFAVAIPVAN